MKQLFSIFGALMLLGAGCLPSVAPEPTPVPESPTITTPAPSTGETASELDVDEQMEEGSLASAQEEVAIKNFAYAPANITVTQGTKIRFTNADSAGHTVTVDTGDAFDSGLLATGESYILDTSTLSAGEYLYHCTLHPFMKGSLTVIEK